MYAQKRFARHVQLRRYSSWIARTQSEKETTPLVKVIKAGIMEATAALLARGINHLREIQFIWS